MRRSIQQALVTGGAGFIGSHLVAHLVKSGVAVTVLDDLSTGRLDNLTGVRSQVRFIRGDIRNADDMADGMAGCEVVFHLAAVVSVPQTVGDPLTSATVNDQGTLMVLEAARQKGGMRVVLSSSCAVYGNDPQLPKSEGMPARPMSPYAVQKLAGELYAGVYSELFDTETVCLRYFNVYGPRQDPSSPYSGVISIFMSRAAAGRTATIHGDGSQYRDFIHVDDVVAANVLAATQTAAVGGIYNIGTGDFIRINELWDMVGRIADARQPPEYAPQRGGDIHASVADIGLAARELGFEPAVTLEKGLADTYHWYRQRQAHAAGAACGSKGAAGDCNDHQK
jgi:nucleoside-diphosphate-sugar epimerase